MLLLNMFENRKIVFLFYRMIVFPFPLQLLEPYGV